jgi:DNA-binding XRE family transcriptional regulator
VYWAIDAFEAQPSVPAVNYRDIDDVVSELETDPSWAEELAQARRESAEELYPNERTLARLRLAKGMSQKALAERLKTTQAQISKLENGLGNPQLTTIVALAQSLDVQLEDLVRSLVSEMKR